MKDKLIALKQSIVRLGIDALSSFICMAIGIWIVWHQAAFASQ